MNGVAVERALIDYLTDPSPVPAQWDIQTFTWHAVVISGAAEPQLVSYFQSLIEHGTNPSAEDHPAETRELAYFASQVPHLDGVSWPAVAQAVQKFGRGDRR
ncbi:MAG: hypothetical protein OEV40_11815 [Acidimicrobiia bacterium]|nr:hypothetical protein [Acidimicrobiia bacterium]